jgi:polysaccharide biosynthesis transport protein
MPNDLTQFRRGNLPGSFVDRGADAYLYHPVPMESVGHERTQLLEYLHIIQRHLRSISLLAVVGGLAGALIAYATHPMYRSRVTLDIQQFDANILNMRPNAEPSNPSSAPAESYIQTEIKILQSDAMSRRVAEKLGASQSISQEQPGAAETSDIAAWSKKLSALGPAPVDRSAALAEIGKDLKVRTLGLTRIVEVLCDARDPRLAAEFCNTLASEYTAQNAEVRWQTTQQTEQWLSHELEDTKRRLAKSEEDLQKAAKDSAVVFSGNENLAQDKLRQLQSELSAAEADRVRKQSQYELAQSSSAEALPFFTEGPTREYQIKLTDLRRQLAQLSTTFTPAHYKVQEVESQIKVLQASLDQERAATIGRLWNEYQAASRRQNLLGDNYKTMLSSLSGEAPKVVQYNLLNSEVESGRQLYQAMLHRVEELGIASAMHASTISVVDRAIPAPRPFSPNWKSDCIGGSLAGILLGVSLACLRSRSDRSLQDPGEAPGVLKVRELGVIPSAEARQSRSRRRRKDTARLPDSYGEALNLPDGGLEVVTLHHKNSAVAESFAAAMNSILFARMNGASIKVIVVTSPEAGDGKSTIASNLAIALAQIDRRVLLIDGDLRRTRLSTLFQSDADPGMIDILRGSKPIGEVTISSIGAAWQLPNLHFLAAGDASLFEPKLLHRARMMELIARVRCEFDVVLIDSPPMVHIADARVLGKLADGVLLVFRAGKTTIDLAASAQRCFMEDGTSVLGTILNDWNPNQSARLRAYGRYASAEWSTGA